MAERGGGEYTIFSTLRITARSSIMYRNTAYGGMLSRTAPGRILTKNTVRLHPAGESPAEACFLRLNRMFRPVSPLLLGFSPVASEILQLSHSRVYRIP